MVGSARPAHRESLYATRCLRLHLFASSADLPRKRRLPIYRRRRLRSLGPDAISAPTSAGLWRASATFNFGEISTNGSGFAGGGQIGCDYQFAGTGWVIGFRDMFDGTSNKRSGTINTLSGPVVANFNNQWFDTLTGRLGYAWHRPGCSTSRAARPGVIPVQTSPLVVFRLARPPGPEQAGQLVVALMDVRAALVCVSGRQLDGLRRSLRTAVTPAGFAVCAVGCPWSVAPRPLSWSRELQFW